MKPPLEPKDIQEAQQQIQEILSKRVAVRTTIALVKENLASLEKKYLKKQSGIFHKIFTSKQVIENIGNLYCKLCLIDLSLIELCHIKFKAYILLLGMCIIVRNGFEFNQ